MRGPRIRWGRLGIATAAAAALLAAPASAATFTVTRTTDAASTGSLADDVCAANGGGCTLRAAVAEANDRPSADAIVLPAGAYILGLSTVIEIKNSATLTGDGARTTSIDAGNDTRVFKVTGGSVGIAGVTIQDGTGGLSIEDTTADVRLDRVAVSGNTVNGNGTAMGGGILLASGKLTVRDSTISGNTANGTGGSQATGGGVTAAAAATSLTMDNVTVAGNRATAPPSGSSAGGGVWSATSTTLRHVTLSGNSSITAGQGGNLFQDASGSTTLADGIVEAGGGGNCGGAIPLKQGHDLSDDSSCALPAAAVGLESLRDHGGPTDTLPPRLDSPALDTAAACPSSGHDQRGQMVPAGKACDVGAAELGADLSASLTTSAPAVAAGGSLSYVEAVRNNGLDTAPATLEFTPPAGARVTFVNSATGTCAGRRPVICSFDALVPGAGASATIAVTAPPTGPMTAFAHTGGPVPDPDPSGDLATAITPVIGPGPPLPDTTAPSLNGLMLLAPLSASKGGQLRYTLSEDATLKLRLDRVVRGRRTRLVRVGTQRLRGRGGAVTAKLRAKWSGHKPKPGRHRLTIVAIDAAGNKAKPKSIAVRVTR